MFKTHEQTYSGGKSLKYKFGCHECVKGVPMSMIHLQYPPLSSLHFKKVSFKIDFLFTESISALYQVSRTIIRDT